MDKEKECCCGHDHEKEHECCGGHEHHHHHEDGECCCGHNHEDKIKELREKLLSSEEETEIVGQSSRIKDVKNLIEKVAESDLPVLITGENGLGKELVAKEIFKKSDRRKNNYIVVSCASMPEETMERELFGYERGAFTGANASKKGLLEEADGGTMFLDDISAMDVKIQSKLLRVIEYGELKRVGGNKTRRVDVRFIVASDKDLKDETEKGKGSFQSIRKSKTDYAITNTAVTRSQEGFRIAIGVRPSKAVLAYKAMEILNSADEITEDVINKACEALDEIRYSSNMRGTGEYRAAVSKVLVKKAIMEVL